MQSLGKLSQRLHTVKGSKAKIPEDISSGKIKGFCKSLLEVLLILQLALTCRVKGKHGHRNKQWRFEPAPHLHAVSTIWHLHESLPILPELSSRSDR